MRGAVLPCACVSVFPFSEGDQYSCVFLLKQLFEFIYMYMLQLSYIALDSGTSPTIIRIVFVQHGDYVFPSHPAGMDNKFVCICVCKRVVIFPIVLC